MCLSPDVWRWEQGDIEPQPGKGHFKTALTAAPQTTWCCGDLINLSLSLVPSMQHPKEPCPLYHFWGTFVKLQFAWLSLTLGLAYCLSLVHYWLIHCPEAEFRWWTTQNQPLPTSKIQSLQMIYIYIYAHLSPFSKGQQVKAQQRIHGNQSSSPFFAGLMGSGWASVMCWPMATGKTKGLKCNHTQ